VEFPAVELDHDPLLREHSICLITGDPRAHHRLRETVMPAELGKLVFPLGARRAALDGK
jgi:hypothetical protein